MNKRITVQTLSLMLIAGIFSGCIGGCDKKARQPQENKQQKETKMTKKVKLDFGLEYEVLTEAPAGAQEARNGQMVTVHYTGWLKNGTKFDSSVDRGQPFKFVLGGGQVIRGWDLGVVGMKVGEKRKLTIPAELGYGARGAGGAIPPNSTLIFDVELLEVK